MAALSYSDLFSLCHQCEIQSIISLQLDLARESKQLFSVNIVHQDTPTWINGRYAVRTVLILIESSIKYIDLDAQNCRFS